MPNLKSAKKRMQLSRVATGRNRVNRSRIKMAFRRPVRRRTPRRPKLI